MNQFVQKLSNGFLNIAVIVLITAINNNSLAMDRDNISCDRHMLMATAISEGNCQILTNVIGQGADINWRNVYNENILDVALSTLHSRVLYCQPNEYVLIANIMRCIEILIVHGADTNYINDTEHSLASLISLLVTINRYAFMEDCQKNIFEATLRYLISVFIDYGAHINIRGNRFGISILGTALDQARILDREHRNRNQANYVNLKRWLLVYAGQVAARRVIAPNLIVQATSDNTPPTSRMIPELATRIAEYAYPSDTVLINTQLDESSRYSRPRRLSPPYTHRQYIREGSCIIL